MCPLERRFVRLAAREPFETASGNTRAAGRTPLGTGRSRRRSVGLRPGHFGDLALAELSVEEPPLQALAVDLALEIERQLLPLGVDRHAEAHVGSLDLEIADRPFRLLALVGPGAVGGDDELALERPELGNEM